MSTPPEDAAAVLRRQAEAVVAKMARPTRGSDADDTVHELLVHQVELEMQNEEMRRLQVLARRPTRALLRTLQSCSRRLHHAGREKSDPRDEPYLGPPTRRAPREIGQAPLQPLHLSRRSGHFLPCEEITSRRRHSPHLRTAHAQVRRLDLLGAPRDCSRCTRRRPRGSLAALPSATSRNRVEARHDLARREQEYRLLAENASDVVFRCSTTGLIEWITPSVMSHIGRKPDQLIGQHLRDFIHPDDADRLTAAQDGLRDGIGFQSELRIRVHPTGYRWFSVSIRPALDDAGVVTHLVGGWQDIQTMVQIRTALDIERTRLRATLDSLLDPHVMLEAVRDEKGKIIDFLYTDANEAACSYNKLSRAQFVGRRLLELLPGHTSTGLLDMYRNALESDQPLVLNDFVYPHEILAQERRYDIRAIRVGDALSFTWRDVTERYQLTQRLAASEEHYRLLTTNSYDTAIRVADDDTVLWISPSIKESARLESRRMDRPPGHRLRYPGIPALAEDQHETCGAGRAPRGPLSGAGQRRQRPLGRKPRHALLRYLRQAPRHPRLLPPHRPASRHGAGTGAPRPHRRTHQPPQPQRSLRTH